MAKIDISKLKIDAIDEEAKALAEAEAELPPDAAAAVRIQRPDPAVTPQAIAERLEEEKRLKDRVSLHFAHVPRFIKQEFVKKSQVLGYQYPVHYFYDLLRNAGLDIPPLEKLKLK